MKSGSPFSKSYLVEFFFHLANVKYIYRVMYFQRDSVGVGAGKLKFP